MAQTNIEYFNYYFKMFTQSIIDIFPEYKSVLTDYYEDLLNNEVCNNDKYVKRFMVKMKDHKSKISNKDETLFSESINILKNVDFKVIWENSELSDTNKEKIWEYLQTMYVLGETIISDCNKIQNLVKNFQKVRNGEEKPDEDMTDEDKELFQMLKNLSENKNTEPLPESFFKDGMIGKLAEELTSEINVEDLDLNMDNTNSVDDVFKNLVSGDNPMKFMNLLQTVGKNIEEKISSGQLNQSKLVEEAQSMMGSLNNSNPLFNNLFKQFGSDNGEEKDDLDDGPSGLEQGLDMMSNMMRNMNNRQRNQMNQMSNRGQDPRASSTRDRLRKKLEAKKNNK